MTTRAEGTGLGLPIVAKIFEDHGGGIELLDASSGQGALVRLTFPVTQAAEQCNGRRRTRRDQEIERRLIMASDILIVDDEADIRELVSGILEDEGFPRARRAIPTRRWRRSRRGGRI